jgi:hypothetical protein
MKTGLLILTSCVFLQISVFAQPEVNYNEDAIEPYVLPEFGISDNGQKVLSTDTWEKTRRAEILNLFKTEVYGIIPDSPLNPPDVITLEQSDAALDNKAIRKQIALVFNNRDRELIVNILLYLPKNTPSPPIFIGYNFYGNHTTVDDDDVILTSAWLPNNEFLGVNNNQATEESRGKRSSRWPMKKIISEGFGVATIYYGDVDPDKNDFTDGIHALFYEEGQQRPEDEQWGAISAWAWGYSKVLDYLKQDDLSRNSRFILFGHSRLGKTSLWAGALDERFDMVISNDSGCGGAALFRRKYGETAAIINENFPHWFNQNFKKYSHNESSLPIDQHMLIALIAPRPVYIASAEDDQWADPKGEYLSGHHASEVYELYGMTGLPDPAMPAISEPIHNTIGYHIRPGKHDVTDYDWEQFMLFARKHLGR